MLEVPTRTRSLKDAAQAIFDYYRDEGQPISRSKAKRVAEQIGKGTFNPDPRLVSAIKYADPTGNEAAANVDEERQRARCYAGKQAHQAHTTDRPRKANDDNY